MSETPHSVGQTRCAKTTRRGRKKNEVASCVALHVPGSEDELTERSEPSSVQGQSDSFIEDLAVTAERAAGPAAQAIGLPVEDVVCCSCLQSDPSSQSAGSPHGEELGNICVDADSLLRFLSASEWASVQQTARHVCPGFKVSSPASVDIGLLKNS